MKELVMGVTNHETSKMRRPRQEDGMFCVEWQVGMDQSTMAPEEAVLVCLESKLLLQAVRHMSLEDVTVDISEVGQKFFPTRRRQACRSASPLLPAVQSGLRHCDIRSMRQQFIPPRRTWVLTRSDCSPTTCAPPAVHDSAGKNFNFLLDVKHTRTQYESLTTQGTYQRSRDRLSL